MKQQGTTQRTTDLKPQHPIAALLALVMLGVSVLVGCSSANSTLAYPPTGTPTPRPDTLYLLNYFYVPGQTALKSAKAWRIIDPDQIQHFYNLMNALPPYPITPTSTTATCATDNNEGILLFFLQRQPTLEVSIADQCNHLNAILYGFAFGNLKSGYGANIASDLRMANSTVIQMVQQAYQTSMQIPVQDIPYQPLLPSK
jgi:hypothetical protein